jgi:hypothetical protein
MILANAKKMREIRIKTVPQAQIPSMPLPNGSSLIAQIISVVNASGETVEGRLDVVSNTELSLRVNRMGQEPIDLRIVIDPMKLP